MFGLSRRQRSPLVAKCVGLFQEVIVAAGVAADGIGVYVEDFGGELADS